MKLLTEILTIIILFCFSSFAKAQSLTHIDIMNSYITPQCQSTNTDSVGALKLVLNKLQVSETDENITLKIESSLFVCTITTDGTQKLSWKLVNPYTGFQVQYYDFDLASIQTRQVFIDPSKPYNRIKAIQFSNKTYSEATASENTDQSFSMTIEIEKTNLLNRDDFEKLNAGEVVQKKVELFQNGNFTAIYKNEDLRLGDVNLDGRNLILNFKK